MKVLELSESAGLRLWDPSLVLQLGSWYQLSRSIETLIDRGVFFGKEVAFGRLLFNDKAWVLVIVVS